MPLLAEDRLLRSHDLGDLDAASTIRQARKLAGLSQAALAEVLDTTQSAVSRWESGREEPRRGRLAQILEACGLRATVVIARSGDDGEVDRAQLRQQLAMSPEQRLASVANVSRLRATARRA